MGTLALPKNMFLITVLAIVSIGITAGSVLASQTITQDLIRSFLPLGQSDRSLPSSGTVQPKGDHIGSLLLFHPMHQLFQHWAQYH